MSDLCKPKLSENKLAGVDGHPSRCDCYTAKTPGVVGHFYNADCKEGMAGFASGHFDLAIVDPPYGVGEDGSRPNLSNSKWNNPNKPRHKIKKWDKKPDTEYWKELFRVSKNQIIWGGNYFTPHLKPKMGWIFWDKKTGGSDYSDGELAWTSFDRALRKFEWLWNGFRQESPERRIHPTQKPIPLYRWILKNYAEAGWKILDTHVGSGSSLIACEREGFDYVGYETDKDYYEAACKRIERETAQMSLL